MIRKKLIQQRGGEEDGWLDLIRSATFEVTSEEAAHPFENALTADSEKWIASGERELYGLARKGGCFGAADHSRKKRRRAGIVIAIAYQLTPVTGHGEFCLSSR